MSDPVIRGIMKGCTAFLGSIAFSVWQDSLMAGVALFAVLTLWKGWEP